MAPRGQHDVLGAVAVCQPGVWEIGPAIQGLGYVSRKGSGLLIALFYADFQFWLGPANVATGGEALVAQYAQGFDLGALAGTFAVLQNLEITRTRLAVFVHCAFAFFFDFGSPQHQQFADVLDGRSVQFLGQGLEHGFAGRAVI
jgi:hypothetical protein